MGKSGYDYAEFTRFVTEFVDESDRAAVILGAAKLDLILYQILQRYLLPEASAKDPLLDGESPLGTFSSRITACYRLGLIDASITRALNMIRKIRNSYAHELSGISLDSGAHRDRVKELIAPLTRYQSFGEFIDQFFKSKPGPGGEFRAAVAMVSLRLEGTLDTLTPAVDQSFSLIPPAWDEDHVAPAQSVSEALSEAAKEPAVFFEPNKDAAD